MGEVQLIQTFCLLFVQGTFIFYLLKNTRQVVSFSDIQRDKINLRILK